ncbi:MAG TPA: molybdopterin cofactor-binding domain-containing protein [Xanthobacteraceae bacterium]|nr:molybdopterin cofactor-binding domain-containing protein [Xanthobacteraceae bacterium]
MTMTMDKTQITRRGALAGLGGFSFCLALGADGAKLFSPAEASTDAKAFNAWVRVAPSGMITIISPGAEMGQGSLTNLPMIVAEEMDADWAKVAIEMAPADASVYGYMMNNNQRMMAIVGSRATMLYYADLRTAGAQVRKVMMMNAAERWGVDASTLRTEPSVVINPANGQRLTYGEIAAFGKVPSPLPAVDAKELKAKKDWRLIGKGVARRDTPLKVNGSAQYSIDVRVPGMVYATTLHSPVHNCAPESWNDAEIKKMPGVIGTVKLRNGVAVVADRFERALDASKALQVTWAKGKATGFDSEQALHKDYERIHHDPNAPVQTVHAAGDAKAAFSGAAKTFKAEFKSDFGYHAQMEPHNAVVRFNDAGDKVEVWEGTQAPDASREAVAKALGFQQEQVTHHQCYLGGGFGRRNGGFEAAEAALIAREIKRPVKMIWTREEDLVQGHFRPQSFQCLEAALDSSGKVAGWKHCVIGDGGNMLLTGGMRIAYYGVPNQQIELRGMSHGVQIKHWRAVAHVFNVFAIESFIDQMAVDANMDPIQFRFERMGATPKARKCFETVAQMCDWKTLRPEGRALGLSISERSGSLGAGVVEISLDRKSGKIKVHKVWVAVDGGIIVSPKPAAANVESAILYGLSSVLHERITLKDGAVEQSNFHDYNLMRMSDTPDEMHVQFVDVDTRPTGLGEIGNPFIAGAISNAFHHLTGKRLRHLPFTPDRVLEVLKA